MRPSGMQPSKSAMKRPIAARVGNKHPANKGAARNTAGAVLSVKANSRRGEAKMNTPRFPKSAAHRWVAATAVIALAGAAAFVPDFHAGKKNAAQEKESNRS